MTADHVSERATSALLGLLSPRGCGEPHTPATAPAPAYTVELECHHRAEYPSPWDMHETAWDFDEDDGKLRARYVVVATSRATVRLSREFFLPPPYGTEDGRALNRRAKIENLAALCAREVTLNVGEADAFVRLLLDWEANLGAIDPNDDDDRELLRSVGVYMHDEDFHSDIRFCFEPDVHYHEWQADEPDRWDFDSVWESEDLPPNLSDVVQLAIGFARALAVSPDTEQQEACDVHADLVAEKLGWCAAQR